MPLAPESSSVTPTCAAATRTPADRVDHEPRQMILRQPIPQRRRQQKRLLTMTINEVLSHP